MRGTAVHLRNKTWDRACNCARRVGPLVMIISDRGVAHQMQKYYMTWCNRQGATRSDCSVSRNARTRILNEPRKHASCEGYRKVTKGNQRQKNSQGAGRRSGANIPKMAAQRRFMLMSGRLCVNGCL
jgi:hypothetical protein